MSSTVNNWLEANDRYLAASVEWLRLQLEHFIARQQPALPRSISAEMKPQSTWIDRLLKPGTEKSVTPLPAPSNSPPVLTESKIAEKPAAGAEEMEQPPALVILSRRFGLSNFEQELLLFCTAMELDTRIGSLCARAHGDPAKPYPTFALALALFDDPAWDVLSPERPLRYWRLIEVHQREPLSITNSPLRGDERILHYVKGLNYLDERLAPFVSRLPVDQPAELPQSHTGAVDKIVRVLQQSTIHDPPVIQLIGADSISKQNVVSMAVSSLGLLLYRLPAEMLPTQPADFDSFVRLWQRESLLFPMALYLDAHEWDKAALTESQISQIYRFLSQRCGVVFLDTRDVLSAAESTVQIDILRPTAAEQKNAWIRELGADPAGVVPLISAQFSMTLSRIRNIARSVAVDGGDETTIKDKLWDSCLAATRPQMDALANRIETKSKWNDLVLPASETKLLHQIADQVHNRATVYDEWGFRHRMNRGLGISALFAGESGTGKTMAAEVIANELRLNLYRIDLSGVVSKYIGETEKNLRRVFDAAEDGGAILFFDEADALFGKRSEVKDSHDRYANVEINYLLQRMEAYRGLAILATNMKTALDPAFMRRIRFIVQFPFPGVNERALIWRNAFPEDVPKDALDFDRLARLNLTGGSIHNIALNASFLAAQAGNHVTMSLIFDAARAEFRKLEKPINESEFRFIEPIAAVEAAKDTK